MPSSWFEPIFPYNIIYDLGTYFLLSLIFLILYKKKIININLFFISLVFLLTPFLFNGFLFDWAFLPDQSKYLGFAYEIRENPKQIFDMPFVPDSEIKIYLPSILYALSPIISLETYKGIALFNRAIFLLTWIFFIKKKFLDKYNSIFFLIIPSLMLYSSVALRDNLIILLMLWFIYFYYQKRFFLIYLTLLLLFLIKTQMLLIISLFIIFDKIIKNNSINFKFLFLMILALAIPTFIFKGEILYLINNFREGFFLEEFGQYASTSAQKNYDEYFKLTFSFSSIPTVISAYSNFIIPPILKGNYSLFSIIHIFEILTIFTFLYLRINSQKNFNGYIFCKWVLILLISYFIYSLIIFNNGTIHRYKVPILFFVIFGYFVNIKFKEKK